MGNTLITSFYLLKIVVQEIFVFINNTAKYIYSHKISPDWPVSPKKPSSLHLKEYNVCYLLHLDEMIIGQEREGKEGIEKLL